MAGIGAAATAVGGVLYVLLTVISERDYDPFGVTPAEVGLGYGAMLIGAAALLLWLAAVVAALLAFSLAATWLAARLGRRWWVLVVFFALLAGGAMLAVDPADPAIAALTGSVAVAVVASRRRRRRYVASALVAVAFGVVVGVGAIVWWAERARDNMLDGYDTAGLWFGPWAARVVSIRAGDLSELPIDRCLLYLGEADGMTVLYDPEGEDRTWRVPTTGLLIEIHPDASSTDCEQ